MSAIDWVWVLANLLMPAWVMAALLAFFAPRWVKGARVPGWVRNTLLSGVLGSLVLLLGLFLTQNDGRMVTYGAMLLVQATLQWWLQRAHR